MSTASRSTLSYFRSSIVITLIGLTLGFFIGYASGDVQAGLSTMFIVGVLGVLETSLSFDNAVVNATVLQEMDAYWRKAFLTWGMLIAVFGMRVVFPVVIVSVLGHINPIEALVMAINDPARYAHILGSSHAMLAGFGGAFLLLVALKYFFDIEKESHWIEWLEEPLAKVGKLDTAEIAVTLLTLVVVANIIPEHEQLGFVISGMMGIVTFIGVESLGEVLGGSEEATSAAKKGLSAFLYLEVLDASFSFDGVIGAFALSDNIFIIAIGLGIGAMFVRSLTLMLVDKGTLAEFAFLENGAFFAIISLAIIMFLSTVYEIPEVVTGLIGAGFIGLSLWSSILHNKKKAIENETADKS